MRRAVTGLLVLASVSLAQATLARAQKAELALVDAVQQQDWVAARGLMTRTLDVNAAQPDGATPLAWAAHWNNLDFADQLIRAGARVNVANDHGVTPLALACGNASAAMVELLLKAGADPTGARGTGETPLIIAARTGEVDVVRLLLTHGANANVAATGSRQTPLMWAISERHAPIVRMLIEAGADVQARSNGGFTPLLFAARYGDTRSAAMLLDAGARADEAAPDGSTPLLIATASGWEDTALLLLERGANPKEDRIGYTALHASVPKNLLAVAKALLARGADPNARLRNAPATLFGRSDGSGTEVRPPVQGAGVAQAPPRSRGTDGMAGATPFWLAARHVNLPMMKVLLEGKADPALTPPSGTTPLMVASGLTQIQGPRARRGDVSQFYTNWNEADSLETVTFLIALGADVNATNASGQTALHSAAYMGGNTVVQSLIERGAKVNVQDAQGQTPYRIAEAHLNIAGQGVTEWPRTAALFRERGADTSMGADGRTLLRKYREATDGGIGGRR